MYIYPYFMLSMEVTIQNVFVCVSLKFVWWRASKQHFYYRDHWAHCTELTLRSDMDHSMPERHLITFKCKLMGGLLSVS
jgi:hypothetical protein